MTLEIDDTKTITEIQDKFSMCFPLLKIDFCAKKHGWQEICPESQIIHEDMPLSLLRKNHNPGTIEVKSWQKVGEVEKEFYNKFGLSVQISYKSGDRWIQTGKSDNVTIAFLMKKADAERNRVIL
jgi:hypothetical protein